ncbi:MAG: hypothetical protein LBC75_09905 [Fibromonadaceae bacterium]|jgi:uncharacterized protein (TIGR02145 family)|nr:hypothetical protein [Fibromonadaceae bacterium]
MKTKIFLSYAVMLCIPLLFSCTEVQRDNPYDSGGINYRGGSGSVSTFTDSRDGKEYKYVKIGDQVWMAEDLAYNASGKYDWATAMNLPSICNINFCLVSAKHQGICPEGWHIPNNDEWSTLMDFVGGSSTAGKYLKATSGWDNNGWDLNGEDKYGFAALPSDGDDYAFWWSATEYNDRESYVRGIEEGGDSFNRDTFDKDSGLGVRCVQGNGDGDKLSACVISSEEEEDYYCLFGAISEEECEKWNYDPRFDGLALFTFSDSCPPGSIITGKWW